MQKPVDGGNFIFGEVAPAYRPVIVGEPGERRMDAQTAFDPRLDGGRAQGRVHFIAIGPRDEAFGEVGRCQHLGSGG